MDILRIRKSPTDPWQEIAALVGPQGPAGEAGPKGDTGDTGAQGPAGRDGYTPIKGTDYYTEADKQEMVQLVLAAITDGNEVSY